MEDHKDERRRKKRNQSITNPSPLEMVSDETHNTLRTVRNQGTDPPQDTSHDRHRRAAIHLPPLGEPTWSKIVPELIKCWYRNAGIPFRDRCLPLRPRDALNCLFPETECLCSCEPLRDYVCRHAVQEWYDQRDRWDSVLNMIRREHIISICSTSVARLGNTYEELAMDYISKTCNIKGKRVIFIFTLRDILWMSPICPPAIDADRRDATVS